MSVFKATKNKKEEGKNSSNDTFKATKNRSYDSTMVYSWEKANKESIEILNTITTKSNNNEYVSSEELDTYRKALDSYIDSSNKLRDVSKWYGMEIDDDETWKNTVTTLNSDYDTIQKYWSNWENEDAYKKALAGQKEYEGWLSFDLEAGKAELDELQKVMDELDELQKGVNATNNGIQVGSRGYNNEQKREELQSRIDELTAQYGGLTGFESYFNEKKTYYTLAERAQSAVRLASVADPESENYDPEFEKYATQGEAQGLETHSAFLGTDGRIQKLGSDVNNYIIAFRNNRTEDGIPVASFVGVASNAHGINSEAEKYAQYMTDEQYRLYTYYYGKYGDEKAAEYLETIEEEVNAKEAKMYYDNMKGKPLLEYVFGIYAGLDQFASGIEALFSDEDYVPTSAMQYASSMVREDLADDGAKLPNWLGGASLGQVGYDAITTTSNMLPSILVSFVPYVGQVAGPTLLGASAAGNAKAEMLSLGYSKGQATTYGLLVGAAEGGLQYLLGGIGKLGGKASKGLTELALSKIDNAFARVAITIGSGMLSEGFEEGLQTVIEPWLAEIATGVDFEAANIDEVLYSSLLGALSSLGLEGVSVGAQTVGTYKAGKSIQNDNAVSQLKDLGMSMPSESTANRLASKIDENSGAYTIGRLLFEVGETLSEKNMSDIVLSLERKGYSNEQAVEYAKMLNRAVEGKYFSKHQAQLLENNEDVSKTFVDIIANDKSTVWQRIKEYSELRNISKNTSKTKKTPSVGTENPQTAQGSTEAGKSAAEVQNASQSENSAVQAASEYDADTGNVTLESASKKYGAQAGAMIHTYKAGQDVAKFDAAYKIAFEMGKAGVSLDYAMKSEATSYLTETQREFAYEAGEASNILAKEKAEAKRAEENLSKALTNAEEKAKAVEGESASPAAEGTVRFEKGAKEKVQKQHKKIIALAKPLASAMGIDIVFYDASITGKKEGQGANGYYDSDTDTIYLDLQNAKDDAKTIAYTLSHELVHFIKKWSPDKYNEFAEFLIEQYLEHGISSASLLREKMTELDTDDVDYAFEEMICDACETMLLDSNAAVKLMELRKSDLELFEKIKLHVLKILNAIREAYKSLGYQPSSYEAKALLSMKDSLEKFYSMFEEAAVDATKNYQSLGTEGYNESVAEENSENVKRQAKALQKKDPTKLKEDDLINLLQYSKSKLFADGSYIPIRVNTPQILIAFAKEMGYTLENYPVAMRVYKARQAVSSIEEWDGNPRDVPHNLDPTEVVEIIRAMNEPSYLIFQTNNERFAEIVKFNKGKEKAYAIIDFFDVDKNAEIMNGYSGGKYNILVTVYPSEDAQDLKNYLKDRRNKVITGEEMKKKGLSQRGLGSYVPAHLNDSPFFEDIITEESPKVKQQKKKTSDKDYLDAIENGDMESAQRMVDEAAHDNGYTIKAYHGTSRGDRVGNVFRPERATSGPMAFFTDNKDIADNYARNKSDTSLAYDTEYDSYYTQFRVNHNGKNVSIPELWNYLSYAERNSIKEKAKHIKFDDDYESIIVDNSAEHGNGAWDAYTLNMHKGNALEALVDTWLETGDLFNRETDFLQVLELVGVSGVEYRDPDARYEKTYDTWLKIQKPFDTDNANQSFYDGLSKWIESHDMSVYKKETSNADMWDKNNQTPESWLEKLSHDIESGSTHAWTVIPDFVTDYLKEQRYDGIKDKGGKGGGAEHTVWIPFSSEQIKSAEPITYDDNGDIIPLSERFNTKKTNIKYSIKRTRNMSWAEQLQKVEKRQINGSNSLYIGEISTLSLLFGKVPFAMNQSDYRKSRRVSGNNKNYSSHAVPYDFFERMPQLLSDAPLLIDNEERVSIITSYGMKDTNGKDSYVIVGVWKNQIMENDPINQAKSAYSLDDFVKRITQAAESGKLVLINKKKAEQMLATIGVQPSEVSRIISLARDIIPQPTASVNTSAQKKSPQQKKTVSNREILASTLEGAIDSSTPEGEITLKKLKEYRDKIELIEKEEARLAEIKAEIKKISFTKGADRSRLKELNDEKIKTANRISIYDRQLLRLEAMKPITDLLTREKEKARKAAEKKGREAMARYRERANKTEMRHKIKDVVNELNKYLTKGTKEKHVPIELQKAVAEALDAVNMDTVGAEARIAKKQEKMLSASSVEEMQKLSQEIAHIEEMGGNMAAKLSSLKTAYDGIINSDDPLIANSHDEVISSTITKVIEVVGNTPLRDMELYQLEAVYDMYRMVLTSVKNANKAFKTAKSEEISVIADRVMSEIDSLGKTKLYTTKAEQIASSFDWNNLKPVYAFSRIGSATFSELFDAVRSGEDTWAVDISEAKEFSDAQHEKYNYKSWDFDKRHSFTSTSGMNFELSLDQIMSLYAYSKRDQAKDHLKKGGIVFDETTEVTLKTKLGIPVKFNPTQATAYNLSDEVLGEIIGTLTEEQRNFVDAMQTYLSDTMGEKGNEVSLALYGVKLYKEKNYFPLRSATQFMARAKEQEKGEVKIKNSGFSKETTPRASNPIVLTPFMDVWAGHVNEMSMYHAFVLPLEDFYRVFNYKTQASDTVAIESVEMHLQNAYGKAATRYIDQLLKDLNGGARVDTRVGPLNKLLGLFKKSAVFASASVTIQQPSAIARALALVDSKYFVGKPAKGKHKELWAEVKKYAPVAVIKEMGYFDTGIGQSTIEWIKNEKTLGDKIDDIASKAPALADEYSWCAIWNAVKRETLHTHKDLTPGSEEFLGAVGKRFTEVIVRTQVYDSVLSRSAYMRSKDTGMNMVTAFMGEPTTSLNMLEDALTQAKRGNGKYARKAIGAVVASMILNSILVSIVYASRDDDEEKNYAEKYAQTLTEELLDSLNPLTLMPFIKDIVSIAQGYDVERSDMAIVSDLVRAFNNLDSDKLSTTRKVTDFAGAVSSFFGLPVKNVMRDARAMYNTVKSFIDGEEDKKDERSEDKDK